MTLITYNGDGLRIGKTDSQGTTTYVYDGTNLIADIMGGTWRYELPGIGFTTTGTGGAAANSSTASATPDSTGTPGSNATTGSGSMTHIYDRNTALGSQIATTNDASTITSVTDYDAFGVTTPLIGSPQGILGFAGKHGYQSDDDSGLQLLGHRYYAPMLGRFLTQDPIGYEGGLNLYDYCNNNPLICTDPTGTIVSFYDPAIKASYNKARTYLVNAGGKEVQDIFTFLEKSKNFDVLIEDLRYAGLDGLPTEGAWFDKDKIFWDPHLAYEANKGSKDLISPALILLHELSHAYNYYANNSAFEKRISRSVKGYDNAEEQRVIGFERKVARKLGEGVRYNHRIGNGFSVDSVTKHDFRKNQN